MVIDHNHVEVEIGVLAEGTLNRVDNDSFAISYGYDDAGFHQKRSCRKWNFLKARLEPHTDSFEMRRRDALHFDLVIAITLIHVIELLLPARPHIDHRRAVQQLGASHEFPILPTPTP